MKFNRHDCQLKSGGIAESLLEHQALMVAPLERYARHTKQRMLERFANGLEAAE